MRATYRVRARLRQAEVLDLAFADELLHGTGDVLDRHIGVDAVLVEEVDALGLEALQHPLGGFLDVLRTAVQPGMALPRLRVDVPAELRGDHHLLPERGQGFADELLVAERPVGFGGVEEGDATLDGGPDDGDSLAPVGRRSIAIVQSHAAVPDLRDLESAAPQRALLHVSSCECEPLRLMSMLPM